MKSQPNQLAERNQQWLQERVTQLWSEYFADMPEYNPVRVEFGRRARTRLGSISLDPKQPDVSRIRVTGWFRDPAVPERIVDSVLVHELCHYAHGFHSGGEQQHRHPHAGGVVRREFAERGLEELYDYQQLWLKTQWPKFLRSRGEPVVRQRRRKRRKRLVLFG